jgi:hypothetical protein
MRNTCRRRQTKWRAMCRRADRRACPQRWRLGPLASSRPAPNSRTRQQEFGDCRQQRATTAAPGIPASRYLRIAANGVSRWSLAGTPGTRSQGILGVNVTGQKGRRHAHGSCPASAVSANKEAGGIRNRPDHVFALSARAPRFGMDGGRACDQGDSLLRARSSTTPGGRCLRRLRRIHLQPAGSPSRVDRRVTRLSVRDS